MNTRNLFEYENAMGRAGVPRQYWNIDTTDLKPESIRHTRGKQEVFITSKTQSEWLKKLLDTKTKYDVYPKIVISSGVTDGTAMAVASNLVAQRVKLNPKRHKCVVFNAGELNQDTLLDIDNTWELCVIHSINKTDTNYKLQIVRDFAVKVDFCPVIIVVCGFTPLEFADRIGLDIQRAFYFKRAISL